MIAPLFTPLLTALYALLGVAVAAAWYAEKYEHIGLGAGALLVAVVVVHVIASPLVTRMPRLAGYLYEARGVLISLIAALVSGMTVVLGITLTGVAGDAEPQKTLITSVTAALTALLGGVFVSAKELDGAVGTSVAAEFKARYWQPAGLTEAEVADKRGQHPHLFEVPNLSPAITAIEAEWDNEWTDWSWSNRHARLKVISSYVRWVNVDVGRRAGGWCDDWVEARPALQLQPGPLVVQGWYPDPTGEAKRRWWDGRSWTEEISNDDSTQPPGSGGLPLTSASA